MGRERTLASRGRVLVVRLLRGAGGDRDLPRDREVVSRLRRGAGGLAAHALSRGRGGARARRRGPDDRGAERPPPGERPPGDNRGRRPRTGGRRRALAPGAAPPGAPPVRGRLTWPAC